MVTFIKTHPNERDWQLDILGMNSLQEYPEYDEDSSLFFDRTVCFNTVQILLHSLMDTMNKQSKTVVRKIGTTLRLDQIDDRGWVLFCNLMDGLAMLQSFYPESINIKELD